MVRTIWDYYLFISLVLETRLRLRWINPCLFSLVNYVILSFTSHEGNHSKFPSMDRSSQNDKLLTLSPPLSFRSFSLSISVFDPPTTLKSVTTFSLINENTTLRVLQFSTLVTKLYLFLSTLCRNIRSHSPDSRQEGRHTSENCQNSY